MGKKIIKIEPKSIKIRKLNVCAYARVSTLDENQDISFIEQQKYYEKYIKSIGDWNYVGIFTDRTTGSCADKRIGFTNMLKACENGEIDLIVTKSISRFSRNLVDMLKIIRELKELNIGVYFERENINTIDEKSEQMLTILSTVAQMEVENQARNQNFSIQKSFEDGTYKFNTSLYGYELKSGKLVVKKDEAKIVKEIFELYIQNKSSIKVAKIINDKYTKTKNDKKWIFKSVLAVLKNEKYTGNSLLQKTYTTETFPKKTMTNRGEKNKYYLKNSHEPIINMDIFELANSIIEENNVRKSYKPRKVTMFGKIMYCKECGCKYHKTYIKGETHWRCRKIPKTEHQKVSNIYDLDLKKQCINIYNHLAKNYKEILLENNEMCQEDADSIEKAEIRIEQVQNEIKTLNRLKIKKYIEIELYLERQNELQKELEQLKNKVFMKNRNNFISKDKKTNDIIKVLRKNKHIVKMEDEEMEIMSKIVDKILVYNRSIEIRLKNNKIVGGAI